MRADSPDNAGNRSPDGAPRTYEITTSYRDTYGGNRGTDMDGWRSATSSPVKAPGQDGASTAEPIASAEYNPLGDIAVLTTGQVLRHRDAMESLVGALKACRLDSSRENEESPATSSLIATNGGTHLMTVNLVESSDRAMRDLCAEGLVEMFRLEPSALEEVASSRETVSKLMGMTVREILGGRSSLKKPTGSSSRSPTSSRSSPPASAPPVSALPAYWQLFNVLLESPSEHVIKSCAEHKIIHKLVDRLKGDGASHGSAEAILPALQAMIDTGNEYYASSFVWNGALDVVLPMLAEERGPGRNPGKKDLLGDDRRAAIARLVASVCLGRREGRSVVEAWVCTAEAVKGLSLLLADGDVATDVQVLVARVLLEVSSVHAKKQDVLEAMVDFCLPRACEIVIDGDEDGDTTDTTDTTDNTGDGLVATAAFIAANLAKDSAVAMEVLIFHANVLRRVVDVLVHARSYDAGRELLQAAGAFSAGMPLPGSTEYASPVLAAPNHF